MGDARPERRRRGRGRARAPEPRPDRARRRPRWSSTTGAGRVVDGDELVGMVDDEDILRVVVAEERRVMTADRCEQGGRRAVTKEQRRTSSSRKTRTPSSSRSGSWSPGSWLHVVFEARSTRALGLPDANDAAPQAQRGPRLGPAPRARTTGSSVVSSAGSATPSTRSSRPPAADRHPLFPRPVPEIGSSSASSRSWPGRRSSFAGLRPTILVSALPALLRGRRTVAGVHGHPDRDAAGRW